MRNEQLAKILVQRSYLEQPKGAEPFRLASGKTSPFYFDCQATTMRAEAIPLIGRAFLELITEARTHPQAAGGLTRGADPIAQAIAYASLEAPPTIDAFSVRKAQKDHGMGRWIEGPASAGMRVVIVDDVITSGGSVIAAIERCRTEGLNIVQVIVLVDREEGGLARIEAAANGVRVDSVYTKSDLDRLKGVESGTRSADGSLD